ncbi:MAG: hypothetical protein ED559_04345 [Phycisphaera sp.]|nr:MAG: hypothetical protein ED559_04345 [Phycisphaera sp.]
MQPTAFQFLILSLTSPRLLARSVRNTRRLSSADTERAVIELLDICRNLESRPADPAGHDPIDETVRLLRSARLSRVRKLQRLIASAYTRLTPEARAHLREQVGSAMPTLVRMLARSETELARRSAVDLACDAGQPALLPSILPLAEDKDELVAQGARLALKQLASTLADLRITDAVDNDLYERITSEVLTAADRFHDHRAPEIMDTALLLLDQRTLRARSTSTKSSWLTERDEAVRMGFRSALRRASGSVGRIRAWEMLTEPEMRKSAIECLVVGTDSADLMGVISKAHLGIRAARRVPIKARVTRAQWPALVPTPEDIDSAPAETRRGLPQWMDTIGADAASCDLLLEPLLVDPDPSARLAALRRAPGPLVRDFAFDTAAPIANSAALRLVHTHTDQLTTDLRSKLSRSKHQAVRNLVKPRKLISRDTIIARRELAHDRNQAIESLRVKLASGDEREITQAVHVVKRLGVADELTDALIETLDLAFRSDDSPAWRIISSVLTIVPELPHPSVARLLAAARSHHNARVRANAVEAEPKRPRGRASSMVEILSPACDDQNHRVKTSALRVLLQQESAPEDTVERVLSTLGEEDQTSRAAALWLVERSLSTLRPVAGRRWSDVAARVAEIARSSGDDSERARATRCARRMLAEVKS